MWSTFSFDVNKKIARAWMPESFIEMPRRKVGCVASGGRICGARLIVFRMSSKMWL